MNTRDDTGGWGRWTSKDKIGKESGADCGVSKIPLSCEFLLFGLAFLQIQLQSLSLDLHEAQMLGSEGVNVCDDPGVSQME